MSNGHEIAAGFARQGTRKRAVLLGCRLVGSARAKPPPLGGWWFTRSSPLSNNGVQRLRIASGPLRRFGFNANDENQWEAKIAHLPQQAMQRGLISHRASYARHTAIAPGSRRKAASSTTTIAPAGASGRASMGIGVSSQRWAAHQAPVQHEPTGSFTEKQ